jgi:hypothetical protein
MSNEKYFAFAKPNTSPENGRVKIVEMDRQFYKGCIYGKADWIVKSFKRNDMYKHNSDELLMFIGSDPDDHENLNAEIELWIENDKLILTQTCIVFVPAGVVYGRMEVKNIKKPVFNYICHINTDTYEEIPAKATAAPGTYANNWVERYEPVDGRLPSAPEGFLTRLLWIDGKKFAGAPYLESVWFHTENDTGPEKHSHDFDEIIGFFGSDAEHPDELGAELTFSIGDEVIDVKKSCLVYIPKGLDHSPILVPKLERSLIHFSGGNGGDYVRKGSDQF